MERRLGIMKRIGRTATLAYLRILTKVLKILHTVAHNEDGLAPGKSTYSDRFSRKLNHNKTPDSKGQCETHRDSVDHYCKVGVDENKDPPG